VGSAPPLIAAALAGLALLVALAWGVRRCLRALHMLQLDSYSNVRLLRWLGGSVSGRLLAARPGTLLVILLGLALGAAVWAPAGPASLALLATWVVGGALLLARQPTPAVKKPLVYTSRAIRILAVALALLGIVGGLAALLGERAAPAVAAVVVLGAALLLTQLAPLAVVLANLALVPVQAAINRSYLVAARRRLGEWKPTVIGITGSYGKTTTKYVVATILRERFDVLMTPHSYNTLMGVTRTINEELRSTHRVFVVEMGAYRPGDIRELAELVRPSIGILTAIGPQHLERFGSLEGIEATKYELIAALPPDGTALFNADDPRCARLADRTTAVRVLRYGVAADRARLRLWAEDVATGPDGSSFTIVTSEGASMPVRTRLLGRHNVLNVLAGAGVALELGMRLEEIAAGIAKLEPAPHRLQRIAGAGGITVLDDSYNANVVGSMEALAVLAAFTGGRRVLVTPGMVELGELEAAANERFGARAAEVCDYIVLVGAKQTEASARKAQFPSERLRVVATLAEATEVLRGVLRPGDVVLFENDLPDLYLDNLG
jgi:UDP-N-acetylmuramoyl-tripeptide--D-alanyl-D-alanine ligase